METSTGTGATSSVHNVRSGRRVISGGTDPPYRQALPVQAQGAAQPGHQANLEPGPVAGDAWPPRASAK